MDVTKAMVQLQVQRRVLRFASEVWIGAWMLLMLIQTLGFRGPFQPEVFHALIHLNYTAAAQQNTSSTTMYYGRALRGLHCWVWMSIMCWENAMDGSVWTGDELCAAVLWCHSYSCVEVLSLSLLMLQCSCPGVPLQYGTQQKDGQSCLCALPERLQFLHFSISLAFHLSISYSLSLYLRLMFSCHLPKWPYFHICQLEM